MFKFLKNIFNPLSDQSLASGYLAYDDALDTHPLYKQMMTDFTCITAKKHDEVWKNLDEGDDGKGYFNVNKVQKDQANYYDLYCVNYVVDAWPLTPYGFLIANINNLEDLSEELCNEYSDYLNKTEFSIRLEELFMERFATFDLAVEGAQLYAKNEEAFLSNHIDDHPGGKLDFNGNPIIDYYSWK